MENTAHLTHSGWTEEETNRLWQEIEAASRDGTPLRTVFERTGQALGRKPNSVRNYYYIQLRAQGDGRLRRATPFETFTPEEVHELLRSVLSARGQGQSVRACVSALAGGDRTKMLRYQNKYRAILRKKPGLIAQVCAAGSAADAGGGSAAGGPGYGGPVQGFPGRGPGGASGAPARLLPGAGGTDRPAGERIRLNASALQIRALPL